MKDFNDKFNVKDSGEITTIEEVISNYNTREVYPKLLANDLHYESFVLAESGNDKIKLNTFLSPRIVVSELINLKKRLN